MHSKRKNIRSLFGVLLASGALLILQSTWIYHAYQWEYNRLMAELEEAFTLAYQKEQTYRVPVVDIVNPGEVSIQSCGNEEIIIVRKCPDTDTIVYNNLSGRSVEKFIHRVFRDLREGIAPMNIFCLSDLFAGILYDKNIPILFVVEHYNTDTQQLLETTSIPEDPIQIHAKYQNTIRLEISDHEEIRALLQITPGTVFGNMTGLLICILFFTLIIFASLLFLYRSARQTTNLQQTNVSNEPSPINTFYIGNYIFNPSKNELQGFGENTQLNKKENAILYALCVRQGNVVERNTLLEENWGSSGLIYSRSLDTYLASLRKYLKKDINVQIVTVKGVGYKLVCG